MSVFEKLTRELQVILGTDVFKCIINNDLLKINQLQAAIALLIKAGIDFNLEFYSGTDRNSAVVELTIFLNPTTTIDFTVTLEGCGNFFKGT